MVEYECPLPQEMIKARRWMLWRYEEREGKPTKVPYQPNGRRASSTDPETWSSFEEVGALEPDYDGIGFVLGEGIAGIDLDGCRNPGTGAIAPWAIEILNLVPDSYAEISPSGTGFKVFGRFDGEFKGHKASMPGEAIEEKEPGWERYTERRYFTVTQNTGSRSVSRLGDLTAAWAHIDELRENGGDDLESESVGYQSTGDTYKPDRIDALLKLDPELLRRWSGSTTGLADESPSGVDMAIADRLAFHNMLGPDIEAALRWRRQQQDLPEKRDGYYHLTVGKALGFAKGVEERGGAAEQAQRKAERGELPKGKRFGISWAELCKLDLKIQWVVEDLIPAGGISCISAKPKVGKSTLARHLAASVAQGDEFLGRGIPDPGQVLYCDVDGPIAVHQLHAIALGGIEENRVQVIHPDPQVCPELANPLEIVISELENESYRMVVLDTLQTALRIKDLNDYAEVASQFAVLRQIATRHDVAIVLVHHDRKAGGEGGDGTLGSTAIFGGVDTLITMGREEDQRHLQTIQRAGGDIQKTFLDLVDGRFWMGQTASEAADAEREQARADKAARIARDVLEAVRAAGEEGLSKAEIEDLITGKREDIRIAIGTLMEMHLAKYKRIGRWDRVVARNAPDPPSTSGASHPENE